MGVSTVYNESSKRATMKYIKENLEEIRFRVPKGAKDRYKAHAQARGKSLTALIVELLERDIKENS